MTSSGAPPALTPDDPVALGAPGHVRLLGECAIVIVDPDGSAREVALSALQRNIVRRLAAEGGRPVDVAALVAAAWGERAPRTARAALHNQISRLRRAASDGVVVTSGEGYALGWRTDLDAATEILAAAETALLGGDPASAAAHADTALRWFGDAPLPVAPDDQGDDWLSRQGRAVERGLATVRLRAALEAGRVQWAIAEAERLVAADPVDEQGWVLLAEACHRAGRRGDALAAIDSARRALRDRLGVEPGPQLAAVEVEILGGAIAPGARASARPIGRDDELDAIERSLAAPGMVLVRGEPGAGSSTVLAEIARRRRDDGWKVAAVTCTATPAAPLAALADLLDDLGIDASATRGLLDGFAAAVAACAGQRPVLLVVDDLHLAGPSTARVLRTAATIEGVGVVASVSVTVPWAPRPEDTVVQLGGLDEAAVAEVAATVIGSPLGEAAAAALARLSGGNTLFVDQLLGDATVLDWLRALDADGAAGLAPPPVGDLAHTVRARLDQLSAAARSAIEVLAVAGREVDARLARRLGVSAEGLDEAIATGLLDRRGGVTGFRHEAVSRVVYDDLAPGRRAELHHAIGIASRAFGAPPATVAHHLCHAGELDPPAAVGAARAAAEAAGTDGAHSEAAGWLEQAGRWADRIGSDRLELELMIERGDALRLAGEPHEELLFAAADRALEIDDPDLLADAAFALLQLGSTTESGRTHARAVELIEVVERTVSDTDRRALVAAASSLAHSMSGHPDTCREQFLTAEQLAEAPDVRRRVLPFAYMSLGLPSDLVDRERLARELLDLAAEALDPVARFEALHLVFSCALQRADGPLARQAMDEMTELIDRTGAVGRRWALLYQEAALAHLEDRLDDAEASAEAALAVFSQVSPSRAMAAYGGQLLVLRWAQGRISELTELLELMVIDQPAVPAWRAALALALTERDRERAGELAALALEGVPEDFVWLANHVIGGRAAALAGAPETIAEYRRRLEPWSGRMCWQGTCCYGPVDTPLAMLAAAAGDADEARRLERVARASAERLGAPVFLRELDEHLRIA